MPCDVPYLKGLLIYMDELDALLDQIMCLEAKDEDEEEMRDE